MQLPFGVAQVVIGMVPNTQIAGRGVLVSLPPQQSHERV